MTEQDFCDDCIHLSPKEHEQVDKRIPHICSIYKVPMYHFNQHPHLPRPIFCNDYRKEKNNVQLQAKNKN